MPTGLDSPPLAPYIPAMAKKPKSDLNYKVIAENRRARHDYAIDEDLEVGIVLMGSEVKSLRTGGANIAESYAAVEEGELWLVNGRIAPYAQAKTWGHEERRKRKLLASKRELSRLWNATQRKGMTLVPLVLYFNHKESASPRARNTTTNARMRRNRTGTGKRPGFCAPRAEIICLMIGGNTRAQ